MRSVWRPSEPVGRHHGGGGGLVRHHCPGQARHRGAHQPGGERDAGVQRSQNLRETQLPILGTVQWAPLRLSKYDNIAHKDS